MSTPRPTALIVLAKEPRPGRVKTRLCPPFTPEAAATLAAACLIDTLAAAAATPATRHVLVLDGDPGSWVPRGFEVLAQRDGTLAQRLGAAFAAVGSAALLIGMDTPQVTANLLAAALGALAEPATDAVLGLADDGGYWAIGLNDPEAPVFDGVPMSSDITGRAQLDRLQHLGLAVTQLSHLRDVDDYHDAVAVAESAPDTCFAATLSTLDVRAVLT